MAGFSMLAIECDTSRIDMRLRTRYLDARAESLDDALQMLERAAAEGKPISIGVLGNAAEMVPELARRARAGGPKPDLVTDQTSAHDPLNGYIPIGLTLEEAAELRGVTVPVKITGPLEAPRFRVDLGATVGDAVKQKAEPHRDGAVECRANVAMQWF